MRWESGRHFANKAPGGAWLTGRFAFGRPPLVGRLGKFASISGRRLTGAARASGFGHFQPLDGKRWIVDNRYGIKRMLIQGAQQLASGDSRGTLDTA